jgi:hypothetical protein
VTDFAPPPGEPTPPPGFPSGPFLHGQSPLGTQLDQEKSQWRPLPQQEEDLKKTLLGEVDRLERVINLAQRSLVIQHAPGFKEFQKAVEDLRLGAQNEMVRCVSGNEQLRILQGRCQAFSSILALMRNTERNIQTLATQLAAAKTKAASMIRPDGTVVPEPIGAV